MLDYEVRVIDDAVPEDLRKLVWEYLLQQTWSVVWKKSLGHKFHEIHEYKPGSWKDLRYPKRPDEPRHLFMPRAHFASDEESLKAHDPIYKLFQCINMQFDGEFEIAGKPEGTAPENSPDEEMKEKYTAPPTQDPSLDQGWRVYANAQPNEHVKRTHGIHRDHMLLIQNGIPHGLPTICSILVDIVKQVTIKGIKKVANVEGFKLIGAMIVKL